MDFSKLKGVIPDEVLNDFAINVFDKYEINTPLRVAHFLAQCSHESRGFYLTEENLNYSGEGLLKVFPKYFSYMLVEAYAHKPPQIASRVYANRMGNGSEDTYDGWKYRGRGFMQLTGKDNYREFSKDLELGDQLLEYPDLVKIQYPLESAAWYWVKHNLNAMADGGSDQQIVAEVTRRINGGYNGLEDRQERFDNIYNRIKA